MNIFLKYINKIVARDNCNINKKCPCLNTTCKRHGKCCECINFHRSKNGIVFCMQDEKISNPKSALIDTSLFIDK